MLFSQDKNDQNNGSEQKKRSIWGTLFNPDIGKDIAPLKEETHMFVRMIALILATNGLFPKDHPALNNTSEHLTMRDVFSIAWDRLSFTKEGIPQVILFFAVFGFLAFTALFIFTFILSLFFGSAHAATDSSLFVSPNGDKEIADNWIDYLFKGGAFTLPSLNGEEVSPNVNCYLPKALSNGLSLFSNAMLVLGGFILLYHLTVMIAETAHSGKFMGRANQVWAPIRLVIAIGLLIPLGTSTTTDGCTVSGYNTGQYAVMKVAKWGSGLASRAWTSFVKSMEEASKEASTKKCQEGSPSCVSLTGEARNQGIAMIRNYACVHIYNNYITEAGIGTCTAAKDLNTVSYQDYVINYNDFGEEGLDNEDCIVLADVAVKRGTHPFGVPPAFLPYFFGGEDMKSICGGFRISYPEDTLYENVYQARIGVFKAYFDKFSDYAKEYLCFGCSSKYGGGSVKDDQTEAAAIIKLGTLLNEFQNAVEAATDEAVGTADASAKVSYWKRINDGLFTNYGWLTAGAWFNYLARLQADRVASITADLFQAQNPKILTANKKVAGVWQPSIQGAFESTKEKMQEVVSFTTNARGIIEVTKTTDSDNDDDEKTSTGNNAPDVNITSFLEDNISSDSKLSDLLFQLFDRMAVGFGIWGDDGTLGLSFDPNRNPLAELAAFGQGNVAMGMWAYTAGGIAYAIAGAEFFGANFVAGIAGFIANVCFIIGSIFVLIGFTIGYIVPLYPFFRFFFASVTWLLTVAEGVVLMPLFALAHLNPYGDGFAGQKTQYGYNVLVQILLRPILMILGLIVSFLIFNACVSFLNTFFVIATVGSGAYSGGMPYLAKLVYTVLYAVLVVILANQAFKPVGLFPTTALRWFGAGQVHEEKLGGRNLITAGAAYVSKELTSGQIRGAFKAPGDVIKNMGSKQNTIKNEKAASALAAQRHNEQIAGDRATENALTQGATEHGQEYTHKNPHGEDARATRWEPSPGPENNHPSASRGGAGGSGGGGLAGSGSTGGSGGGTTGSGGTTSAKQRRQDRTRTAFRGPRNKSDGGNQGGGGNSGNIV